MYRTVSLMTDIHNLYGVEEFKTYCEKLRSLANNCSNYHLGDIPIANLIISAEHGCGSSYCAQLLTQLVDRLHLIRLVGEEMYFEHLYVDDESSFHSFMNRLRSTAGFYGSFKGVINIKLQKTIQEKLPEIDRLLDLARRTKGNTLFIFTIPHNTPSIIKRAFYSKVASRIPSEYISITGPNEDEMLNYTSECRVLWQNGLYS